LLARRLSRSSVGSLTLALVLCACTSAGLPQPDIEQPVTSIDQLAGAWSGWHTYGGIAFRVNVNVKPDGATVLAFANNPAHHMILVLESGKLRFGYEGKPTCCAARFFEQGRRQYLTFFTASGGVWVECQRDR
jgi:hypothetical protein